MDNPRAEKPKKPVAISKDLEKRIAAQREREQTLALMRKRKKKEADEEAFSNVIAECRDKKNRRKLVVTLERVLDDDENELNEESPLVVKVRDRLHTFF